MASGAGAGAGTGPSGTGTDTGSGTGAATSGSSTGTSNTGTQPVAGDWHGTTSQGRTLGFKIANGVMTDAFLAYDITGAGCAERAQVTMSGLAEPVTGGRLSGTARIGANNATTLDTTATFSDSSSVSGTVTLSSPCGRATATWTAEPGVRMNSVPVANAGPDQTLTAGSTVALNASASDDADNDPLQPRWTLQAPAGSSAQLLDSMGSRPTFRADVPGTYVATLIQNDGTIDSAPDTVSISVTPAPNQAPVISRRFGYESDFEYNSLGQLIGAVTTVTFTALDPDGDALSWNWSSTNTANVTWNDGVATWRRSISFGRPAAGSITGTVSDGKGGTDAFTVNFN